MKDLEQSLLIRKDWKQSCLVGVLIKAKEKGLITQVKEVLFELKNDAGFWLGEKLQKQILEQIGEL